MMFMFPVCRGLLQRDLLRMPRLRCEGLVDHTRRSQRQRNPIHMGHGTRVGIASFSVLGVLHFKDQHINYVSYGATLFYPEFSPSPFRHPRHFSVLIVPRCFCLLSVYFDPSLIAPRLRLSRIFPSSTPHPCTPSLPSHT